MTYLHQRKQGLLALLLALLLTWESPLCAAPWRYVSMPDFLNMDLGDISSLPTAAGRNSTNATWQTAINTILDSVQAENPDFVTIAGDMTMDRWISDGIPGMGGTGVFGPVTNLPSYQNLTPTVRAQVIATEEARARAAGSIYYPAITQGFQSRGLDLYPAVGDHELGDDFQWSSFTANSIGSFQIGDIGVQTVPVRREIFSDNFVKPLDPTSASYDPDRLAPGSTFYSKPTSGEHAGTAYAIQHKNTLLVSLDVFKKNGSVIQTKVDGAQLSWLSGVLDQANADPTIDHILVQGHAPILNTPPVPLRQSGGLHVEGDALSPVWQLMREKGVDLYLNGEVHADSVRQDGVSTLLQIAHGAALGFNPVNTLGYLVTEIDGDKINLTMKRVNVSFSGGQLFQASRVETVRENIFINGPYFTVGTLTIDNSGSGPYFTNATGLFANVQTPPETSNPGVNPIAPNSPMTGATVLGWYADASSSYSAGPGTFDASWQDRSGAGRNLTSFAGRSVNGNGIFDVVSPANADPTLKTVSIQNTAGGSKQFSAVGFSATANELLKTSLKNPTAGGAEARISDVTMFVVYRSGQGTDDPGVTRPVGIGSFRDTPNTTSISSGNNLNLASDGSIRLDNGSFSATTPAPANEWVIRSVSMSATGGLQQWLRRIGTSTSTRTIIGNSFTTRDADLFLGDLRTDSDTLTQDFFDIAEVIVYDAALSDQARFSVEEFLYRKYFIATGDYNADGLVNAADLEVWRDEFGSSVSLKADGNGDGIVDAADYTVWRDNSGVGAVRGEPALAPVAASVPEAPALLSLLAAIGAACGTSTLRRRRAA